MGGVDTLYLVIILIFAAFSLVLYSLPAVIAFSRGHHYRWPILVLTIAGGWTGVLWFVALAWAVWPNEG